jgi:hypothetical protein
MFVGDPPRNGLEGRFGPTSGWATIAALLSASPSLCAPKSADTQTAFESSKCVVMMGLSGGAGEQLGETGISDERVHCGGCVRYRQR